MKNRLLYVLTVVLIAISSDSKGQSCECTDCPIPILDNTLTTSCLDVSGLTNPTLGVGGQDVCGIEIQFDHTWLTEVSFTLIAPDGSSVVLVPSSGFGSTPNSTWDIDFVPCSESADPDAGFPAVFNPGGYANGAYTGTYYPGVGCFEDLTGPANGTWKLEVEDFVIIDEGEVTTWSIIFCDGTGTECGPELSCEADAGTYNTDAVDLCINDADLTAEPFGNGQAPPPDYNFTYTISNVAGGVAQDILAYSENADFAGFSVGTYIVCGLSYLASDEPLLPLPDGIVTNADIQTDIDNMAYCADISSDCFFVSLDDIVEAPDIIFPDTLCVDEVGVLEVLNYDPEYLWLIDINGNFSMLDFLFFPTISYAGGGNTNFVEICIEFESACGDMETCVTTVIVGAINPDLEIIGETETCYGNTYEYTISNTDGMVNFNWFIDPLEDSFIIGSSTDETVTVGLPSDPDQFSASICFEYEDYCGNMDEICIDITPNDLFFEEDLTPDSYCDLSGDFNIVANGDGSGTWTQTSGPGTSIFNDPNVLNTTVTVSEAGMYSFTFTTNCGSEITVDIEFFEPTGEPIIDGVFIACPGALLTFSVVDLAPNTIVEWFVTGDAAIDGPADQSTVDVLLNDPGNAIDTEICLTYLDQCASSHTICEDIEIIEENLVDLSQSDNCNLDFILNVQVNGMDGTGQWTLISGPGTPTYADAMNSVITVSVDAIGEYVFEFTAETCGTIIQVPISIYDDIDFENLTVECIGEEFIVSFDILGGVEPYTVNGEIVSNNFTSEILSGIGYSFTVDDNSICNNIVITGNSNCECETEAGSISPQELIVSCDSESVSIFSNGDAIFDSNDGAIFILYTDLLDPFGSIALENTTGIFSFVPPLQYGTIYYVAYVVGNELAGTIDYTDPCVDLATGASIIFSEPFDLSGIESTEVISCDIVLELMAIQETSEEGEWSVLSGPTGGEVIFDGVNGISTFATFSEAGTYVIRYTIDNGFCIDTQEITIEVTEPVGLSIVNISYICDDDNENYQVSFEIEGGTSPFIVEGETLSNNVFISSFIPSGNVESFSITDANGCEPYFFISEFTCIDNCVSYAEMDLIDLVELCEDESFTATASSNSILEGDDIGVFILHTNSGNVLGTILDQNTTGEFSYLPILDFETIYYISFVVGNELAGEVDLSDACLSVSPGQGIVFYERPSATINFDTLVCSFDIDIDLDIIVGDSWTWSVISSPMGSSISFIDTAQLEASFTVDREGEYIFQLLLKNGPCFFYDTLMIEVFEESSVLVMDDFSTCETAFDIYSFTTGSPKSWEVIGTTDFMVDDNDADSTIISFDNSGIFEIVRSAGTGICMASDTFTVEVFQESSFTITNIVCAEDKITYTVEYSIDGDAYPYDINGQIIDEGESIDLIANSGDSLVIRVLDTNLCEIYNETIFFSCECESEPGEMDQNLIESCFGEPITVLPAIGSVLADFDFLVYVLHTSSGLTINNILSVSINGEFDFDPLLMTYNTVYYVSSVVFHGDIFDEDILDEVCTKGSAGTPVLWLPENIVQMPGSLIFCEDEDVEFTLNYSGVIPITLRLLDEFGNSYEVIITEEGESIHFIDLMESSTLTVDSYLGTSCSLDVDGDLEIELIEQPNVQFASDIITCNSSVSGSIIVLDDLIISSNTSGSWFDSNSNPVSGSVDFDGEPAGGYIYQYVTMGNEPCEEITYGIPILVEECDCPMDIFLPFEGLCQGEYLISLNEYLNPVFVDMGSWSIATVDGSGDLGLMGSDLTITSSNFGIYQATYTLNEVPQGCDAEFSFDIEISQLLSSGTANLDSVEICVGDLFEIVLFEYLDDYDDGGEWVGQGGLVIDALTGLVDLSTAEGGLYTFDYEIPENEFCPASATEISILIHEPLELFLSIIDPLCFGLNDGSVSAEDVNGNQIEFDLFNDAQESISSPDSLFAGDYELRVVDENGCVIVENFTLVDPLELFLDLGEDRIVEEGEVTTISPVINFEGDDISLFQWFANQASLDIPTFDTLLISPDGETNIQLIITDDDGCIVADELLLTVISNEVPVVLANAFNPKNTTFGIEAFKEIVLVNSFSIYDRWGSLVFNKRNFLPTDPTSRWDGTNKGSPVVNGVYVFSITYTNTQGSEVSIFGDVTVVRL